MNNSQHDTEECMFLYKEPCFLLLCYAEKHSAQANNYLLNKQDLKATEKTVLVLKVKVNIQSTMLTHQQNYLRQVQHKINLETDRKLKSKIAKPRQQEKITNKSHKL